MPEWLQGDILDVRTAVTDWLEYGKSKGISRKTGIRHHVSSSAEILITLICNSKLMRGMLLDGEKHAPLS